MATDNYIPITRKLLTRLFSKIQISTEHFYNGEPCWDWIAGSHPLGYGRISVKRNGKHGNMPSHRLIYELFVEHIPDNMQCDHLCRRPSCNNPLHIEIVTPKENYLRGLGMMAQNARKTHCIRGHALIEGNLQHSNTGRRVCKHCRAIYKKTKHTQLVVATL